MSSILKATALNQMISQTVKADIFFAKVCSTPTVCSAKARTLRKSEILGLDGLTCWASTLGGHSRKRLWRLENKFSLSMKDIGTVRLTKISGPWYSSTLRDQPHINRVNSSSGLSISTLVCCHPLLYINPKTKTHQRLSRPIFTLSIACFRSIM